jgi:tape measure domain-containing protein
MATSNSRDVSLKLLVDTVGQDSVDKLRAAFDQLAKEGASAAPEVKKLTDQIDRLTEQSAAITNLQRLGDEAQALAAKESAAAESAARLRTELDQQRVAVEAARIAQAQATAEVLSATRAFNETGGAIRVLRTEYDAAGQKSDEFRARLADLINAQVQQKNAIAQARLEQTQANREFTAAVRAQTSLETAQTKAAASAQAAADAVQRQAVALREAREEAAALGITTDDLAAAETALAAEMRSTVAAAQARIQAIRETAEADRLLAIEEQGMVNLLRQGEAALQAEVLAQRDAARAAEAYTAAIAEQTAAQRAAERAAEAEAEAKREQAESDRLAIIQLAALAAARQRGAADLQAERAALRDAAQVTQQYTARLEALRQEENRVAAASQETKRALDNAFSTVGVKSVEALRLEIANVRTSMAVLQAQSGATGAEINAAFATGQSRINALEREIRGLTGQLTLADRAANVFKNSLGQIAAGNVIADGVGYLVNKVKEMGREFIEVTVQTERLRKGLQAIYRDTQVAGRQFQFLRDTANQSGFAIGSSSDAFLRFSAATKSANIPLSVTNELFTAVTRAGVTLGLTSEGVTGTLDALGQMASKGTVSMEELRQQLGDRLPGALSLAAQGLGITDQQLIKLVESGQLATRDFFPAFAAGLRTMAGDTDTLTSSWARFTNMLNEFSVAVGDAGGLQVLKGAISALAVVVGVVLVPLQGFAELLSLVGNALGRLGAAFSTGNFKAAFEGFGEDVEKAGARIERFHKSIDVAVKGTGDQTKALQTNSVAMEKSAAGVLSVVAAQERLAAGTAATGSAFVQQIVRLQENAVAVEASVIASEKLLKAKQDEGKALVLTANLTGDASKALEANALATTQSVAASEQVYAARQREAFITQQSIALINNERDATGRLTSDRQAALDKLNATLVVQEAEVEKSRQTTFELGRQALAAQAAADAYADNTTKLTEYQRSMESARTEATILTGIVEQQTFALGELKEQLLDGKITQEFYDKAQSDRAATIDRLNAATGAAAKFENLYRDAVADSVASVDRKARAEQASLSVTQALAKVQQAHYETLARQAKAMGDEAAAIYYTIEAKQREIKVRELAMQIKELEAAADKAALEIQIAALDPQDKLYQQKKQELEIRLQIVKAKQIEAQASREVIKGIEDEITALRNKAAQQGGSVTSINAGKNPEQEGPKDSFGQTEKGARPGSAPSAPSGGSGLGGKPPKPDTKSPFSFSAGGDLQTRTGVANFLRSAGVTDPADIQRIVKEFSNAKGEIPYINNPGQKKYADGGTISQALLRAAERVTMDGKGVKPRAEQSAATGAPAVSQPASGGAVGGSKTINININIGGKSTPVRVASDVDANNLIGVLRGLESAAGTSAS